MQTKNNIKNVKVDWPEPDSPYNKKPHPYGDAIILLRNKLVPLAQERFEHIKRVCEIEKK